jgi:site-specific recombinase XerD
MSIDPNETAHPIVPIIDISPVAVAGHASPVMAYLAGLSSAKSRRTMLDSLNTIASMTGGRKNAFTFEWHSLTFAHTSAIRSMLAERYSAASASLMLAALRGVLKACWRLNLMDGETYQRAADVAGVKGERLPSGRSLDGGELRQIFAVCSKDRSIAGRRDAAMLAILYGGGCRRSEAVSIDVDDYDPAAGSLRVQGKGNKERLCYLSSGAKGAVDAWLVVRGIDPGPMLQPITKGGIVGSRAMTAQALYARLRMLAKRAGIKNFSPHDLRRSFVSDLLDAGADASMVQRLAGHANVQTTLRYDRRPEQAKKRAAELLYVPFEATESRDLESDST